ncbi:uncharacterized protein C8orf87 [Nomascus leucogenys]|uniref:uncharacterized protein C8orf87 n=1 Tax=Nomascus leucogenys TaxID=61853 RepID=UPI00020ACB58|nr:uncharacterized protein C8orf87 [Nomascus leucogenys]
MRTPKRTRSPKRKVSPMRGETLTLQLTTVSLDTRHMVKWCDERHGRPLPHTQESQHGSATSSSGNSRHSSFGKNICYPRMVSAYGGNNECLQSPSVAVELMKKAMAGKVE